MKATFEEALRVVLAPLIKEVVLATIEEYNQAQQAETPDYAEITPDEAAEQLHVSKVTLWRWNNSGYLKPVWIGRKTYYRQSDIVKIKSQRSY